MLNDDDDLIVGADGGDEEEGGANEDMPLEDNLDAVDSDDDIEGESDDE